MLPPVLQASVLLAYIVVERGQNDWDPNEDLLNEFFQNSTQREAIYEAIHVASAIQGGACLIHGVQMRNHAEKLGM